VNVELLMSRKVVTVAADAPLKDVAALLTAHRISGVPVSDREGRIVGVVSETDILRREQGLAPRNRHGLGWLGGRAGADERAARTAGDAMTSPAITIAPNADVADAARLMIDRAINRLPVVERGKLVGIVARADLVRAFQQSDEEIGREIRDDVLLRVLWLDPGKVNVSVADGEVVLIGEVENRSAAELAEAYVRRVPGVVSVVCQLTWAIDDLARRTAHPAYVEPPL
jgi:CBS domain-containing protein